MIVNNFAQTLYTAIEKHVDTVNKHVHMLIRFLDTRIQFRSVMAQVACPSESSHHLVNIASEEDSSPLQQNRSSICAHALIVKFEMLIVK